jgi:hypothetical protein
MIEPDELPEYDSPQVTNITQADVKTVRAEQVRMYQADAENIVAQEVELKQSAAGNVKANHIHIHQSAIAIANATEISVNRGAVGFVQVEKMSSDGYTGAVLADSAELRHGLAHVVVGRDVHVEGSRTGILFARNLSGNVTTLLDARGALIVGLVSSLFAGLMLLLIRSVFRRE